MIGPADGQAGGGRWRIALWGGAAALLAMPAVAMRFTAEVDWTASDFALAAVLVGAAGLALELAVRRSLSLGYRAGAALAVAAGVLTIVATGAVGMIGSEDNPYNLLFLGVVALALAGALLARFRARGMAIATAAAAAAQLAVSLGGLSSDPTGAFLSAGFAGLWLGSAALFGKAGRAGA